MILKIINKTILIIGIIHLSACLDENVLFDAEAELLSNSRFNIASYTEVSGLSADLSGIWMTVHNGQLLQSSNGVDFNIKGFIRELVEIRLSNGQYELRSCMEPETLQILSISGDDVSVNINQDLALLTRSSNTFMSGTASHSETDSSYSGTLSMKKVAALDSTFGSFSYYNAGHITETKAANCFQEAYLHVVGKKLGISQWSDVEALMASSWVQGSDYEQSSYLFSRAGTASPAKQLNFVAGTIGGSSYEMETIDLSVAASQKSVNFYQSTFTFDASETGTIDLMFDIGVESTEAVVALPETAASDDSGSGSIGDEWWKDVWSDWFLWWPI